MAEVFPVVHIQTTDQALEQSAMALEHGADGLYFISHEYDTEKLVQSYELVRKTFPCVFLGINFLEAQGPVEAYNSVRQFVKSGLYPDALWVDDLCAGLPYGAEFEMLDHLHTLRTHPDLRQIRLLGGISFKGTSRYKDEAGLSVQAVVALREFTDVVTTSGPGTNRPPSIEKIVAMKAAAGEKLLAVASGVSDKNITDYQGAIDQILVASSLETEVYSGVFVPKKIDSLIRAAKLV